VELIEGEARFVGATRCRWATEVTAEKFIVATGSRPIALPGFDVDGDRIVDSTGALLLGEVPKRFMALGGSAIGLEFADVYAALGSEVTVVELLDRIAPLADPTPPRPCTRRLAKRGITIKTGTKAVSQTKTDAGTEVVVEAKDGSRETIVVDKLLVAVGRTPNGKDLGLEQIGVSSTSAATSRPPTRCRRWCPTCTRSATWRAAPLLAHKAMKEGIVAAEHAAGRKVAYDTLVPSVIYTHPELASVGMTEPEAKEAGFDVRVGSFPLTASGRATTMGATDGVMKIVADAATDLVLGVHTW
jgi:dihydrolipoamide dehydrogenase